METNFSIRIDGVDGVMQSHVNVYYDNDRAEVMIEIQQEEKFVMDVDDWDSLEKAVQAGVVAATSA